MLAAGGGGAATAVRCCAAALIAQLEWWPKRSCSRLPRCEDSVPCAVVVVSARFRSTNRQSTVVQSGRKKEAREKGRIGRTSGTIPTCSDPWRRADGARLQGRLQSMQPSASPCNHVFITTGFDLLQTQARRSTFDQARFNVVRASSPAIDSCYNSCIALPINMRMSC